MNDNRFSMNKFFWGLLFLLGAASLLLNRIHIWPTFFHISLFDIVLTIFFIWLFLDGLRRRNFFKILFALAFIAIQYDELLKITAITPWTLLGAALLASIGLTIIFPGYHHNHGRQYNGFGFVDSGKKVFNESDGETLYFKNSFGSSAKYVNTNALVNATFENSFGEMQIYFDNTVIKNGTADINLDVSFGNAILYIPSTWNVENHVKTSFGTLREQNTNHSQGCPTLRIYGEIAFGDALIIYI